MRTLRFLIATFVALVALAVPAAAHVSVTPKEAERGSDATLTFRVPNERDDAATVELAIELPADLERIEAAEVPGWTAAVEDGAVRWTGGRIEPDQSQEFTVTVGPLPADDRVVFRAVQTYDSGEVVRWVDESHDDDHPAPTLTLTGVPPGVSDDEADDGFPVAGLVAGLVVFVLAVASSMAARRRRA